MGEQEREFEGISLENLNRDWKANLKGGWCPTVVRRGLWKSHPPGVPKLNFDGS